MEVGGVEDTRPSSQAWGGRVLGVHDAGVHAARLAARSFSVQLVRGAMLV